jgi:hypothetical protein
MRDLYADNYPQRRLEVLLRAEGRCENKIEGQRCPNRLGTFKISHSYQPYFEQLYMHHPNSDPENPDAEMIAVCASCHMKLHRQPESNGKTSSRKQGYKVISINHLLCRLASVGFTAVPNEECRFDWSIGPFTAEAADPVDALLMALHWLTAEVGDLKRELEQQRTACHRLADMQTRMRQAEERRLTDAVLREMRHR